MHFLCFIREDNILTDLKIEWVYPSSFAKVVWIHYKQYASLWIICVYLFIYLTKKQEIRVIREKQFHNNEAV